MKRLHASVRHAVHSLGNDYDFRVPIAFKILALIGVFSIVAGSALAEFRFLLWVGLVLILPTMIVWSTVQVSRRTRFQIRDRMVQTIPWRGNELVLDVGTGNGITLIGCAQQLTTGKGVGIDIWDPNAGGGTPDIFWRNARKDGVGERVELQNVDARKLPFEDESFDAIVSSFALHHIADGRGGLEKTAYEMLRVLKVGGYVTLCDISPMINACAKTMERAGMSVKVEQASKMYSFLKVRKEQKTITPVYQEHQHNDHSKSHAHHGHHHFSRHDHNETTAVR